MLRVVVYDVCEPRRLRRVAEACEDYGVRVQKSVFECWLEEERLQSLLGRLENLIEPKEDCITVYTLDAAAAARRQVLGERSTVTDKRSVYLF